MDLGVWLEARMAREMSWEKVEGEERTGRSVEKEDMVDVGVGRSVDVSRSGSKEDELTHRWRLSGGG